MAEIVELLAEVVGAGNVLAGDDVSPDYAHDEALTATPSVPLAVVRPGVHRRGLRRAQDRRRAPRPGHRPGQRDRALGRGHLARRRDPRLLRADERHPRDRPRQPRGRGPARRHPRGAQRAPWPSTGSSTRCSPASRARRSGATSPPTPAGMRAIKYGVTRHHVLGLEAVLANGDVIRTGGKFVKTSTGYDLTQLLVGSEGTLALVTEATLKLHPRLPHAATVLAPFTTLDEVTAAVPRIVAHGIGPLILEYVDMITMAAITANVGLDLGIPEPVRDAALAYLVIVLESTHEAPPRRGRGVAGRAAGGARRHGGLRPAAPRRHPAHQRPGEGVLRGQGGTGPTTSSTWSCPGPPSRGTWRRWPRWPRSTARSSPGAATWATATSTCRSSSPTPSARTEVLRAVFRAGMDLGGAISGEHGIGTEKKKYFLELEDPVKVELMRADQARLRPPRDPRPRQPARLTGWTARRERRPGTHQDLRRQRRRRLLRQPRDLGDALRGRPRRRARDAGRPRALRRGGHRRRRRLRPDGAAAGRHLAAPRARARQRHRQPPQRPAGPDADRERRRRPRHHPPRPTTLPWPRTSRAWPARCRGGSGPRRSPDGARRRRRRPPCRVPSARPVGWPPWWCRPTCRGRRPGSPPRAGPARSSPRVADDAVAGAAKALRSGEPAVLLVGGNALRRAGPRGGRPGGAGHGGQAPVRDLPGPDRARGRASPPSSGSATWPNSPSPSSRGPGTWSSPTPSPRCRSSPTPGCPGYLVPDGCEVHTLATGADDVAGGARGAGRRAGGAARRRRRCQAPARPDRPTGALERPEPGGGHRGAAPRGRGGERRGQHVGALRVRRHRRCAAATTGCASPAGPSARASPSPPARRWPARTDGCCAWRPTAAPCTRSSRCGPRSARAST